MIAFKREAKYSILFVKTLNHVIFIGIAIIIKLTLIGQFALKKIVF